MEWLDHAVEFVKQHRGWFGTACGALLLLMMARRFLPGERRSDLQHLSAMKARKQKQQEEYRD